MKYISLLVLLLCIQACALDENKNITDKANENAVIFESEIGIHDVYGVRIQLSPESGKKEYKGLKVSLFQDDKVWIDTVYVELTPNDTLETDIIFSESRVNANSNVNFKIEPFAAQ